MYEYTSRRKGGLSVESLQIAERILRVAPGYRSCIHRCPNEEKHTETHCVGYKTLTSENSGRIRDEHKCFICGTTFFVK